MALTATLLAPADVDKIDAHYPALVAGVDAQTRCSFNAPALPDLAWLRSCVVEEPPMHEVTIFADNKGPAGLVVVNLSDGRIAWECVNNKHPLGFQAITGVINSYCVGRYGAAWGFVENPIVRDAMKAARPAFVEDGILLRLEQ